MPYAVNGNISLHYEVRGEGETLILSSGLGGTSGYWQPQMEYLSRRFRVVTYDHAGSGKSSRSVGARTVSQFASDMLAVIRASGAEHAHVLGHAVGGITGLQLALDAPGVVRSLVMGNAWGEADPHIARCFSVRMKLLEDSGLDAYIEAQPLFLYPATWISEYDRELRAKAGRMPEHIPSSLDLSSRVEAFLKFAPPPGDLAGLDVPVLCLATKDDMLVPWTCSQRLAQQLGNGIFKLLPWGGHGSSETAPGDFEAALEAFYQPIGESTSNDCPSHS